MSSLESDPRVRALEALARVTDCVARAERQQDICAGALDALEYAIGVRRAAILLFDGDDVMRFCGARGISEEYKREAEGHSPWSSSETNAAPIVISDAMADLSVAFLRDAFQRENIGALVFVPLLVGRSLIGKFMVYWDEPHAMSEGELEAAVGIANRVALGIDRLRSAEALRASRDQLATILAGIIDGVTVVNPDGRLIFANPAAARLLGQERPEDLLSTSPGEVISRYEIFDEEGNPLTAADLPGRLALRGETPPPRRVRFRNHQSGEERWATISAAPIFSEGRVVMAINVFRDVTDAQRARERERFLASAGEILASTLDYETTLKSVAHLAVPVLGDWCRIDIATAEGGYRRLVVVHKDPEKRRWADEIERRFVQPQERGAIARIIATGNSEIYPDITDEMLRESTSDTDYLAILRGLGMVSAMSVPLSARGRTFGVITLISSESGRRYTHADLAFAEDMARRAALAIDNAILFQQEQEARAREQAARSQAETANRAKDDFLATVSHELRTPLTAVLGWSRMLTTMPVDDDTRQAGLVAISRAAEAQSRIIDDLLDVSRIITGKLRLEVAPVMLSQVISAAVDSVRHAAVAKQIALKVSTSDVFIRGDADRLQQVLWNLLSNAVKFTPEGGQVSIRSEKSGGSVRIMVSDTGSGIVPNLLPYVFDRFRQADSSATRAFGGLGLGLSIVRSLVEMHGGTVTAESAGDGKGATFTVSLPLLAAGQSGEVRQQPSHDGLHGHRVLLVEDDDGTRVFLQTLLQAAGAEVRAASSVANAMAIVEEWSPNAVVTDVAMPEQDGYALLDQLRARPATRDIPAIAVTAYGRPEDRERAMRAGFSSYVRKPVDPGPFIETVASVIAGN